MLIRKKNKGYIEIAGGKVDITDPCYEKGTWYQLTDVKIKPGTYRCRYYKKTRKKAHGFNRGMNFVMFPKCM